MVFSWLISLTYTIMGFHWLIKLHDGEVPFKKISDRLQEHD